MCFEDNTVLLALWNILNWTKICKTQANVGSYLQCEKETGVSNYSITMLFCTIFFFFLQAGIYVSMTLVFVCKITFYAALQDTVKLDQAPKVCMKVEQFGSVDNPVISQTTLQAVKGSERQNNFIYVNTIKWIKISWLHHNFRDALHWLAPEDLI